MKILGFVVFALVILAVGFAGGGYAVGGRSAIDRVSGYLTGKLDLKGSDASAAEVIPPNLKPLFYRDPMGRPEISPVPKKDSMGMDYIPVYPDADQGAGKILFYRNPMGEMDVSPVPKQDSMGMDYIPVREQPAEKTSKVQRPPETTAKGRPLYYRNPMGLPDISYEPKKDSMGMDYIPVYENTGGSSDGNVVQISLDKVQKLGVMTAPATEKQLSRSIRAVGSVQPDESRQIAVSSRFDGWVDKLYVSKTGDQVEKGQKLLEVSSPDLRAAQRNYLTAIRQSPDLVPIAVERLQNQGLSKQQVAELKDLDAVPSTTGIYAASAGQVVEKNVIQGAWIKAGDLLYRLVDLRHVWVIADVYERDLPAISPGEPATIKFTAYPGRTFAGTVSLVYPEISMSTRTAKVRIELDNPDLQLRPGMYADVEIATKATAVAALSVPESAILDDGQHQTVLVALGEGKFEPRALKLGARADGYAEVLSGLAAGETVVVSANFLIDAESNLQAALSAFVGTNAQTKTGEAERASSAGPAVDAEAKP
jgi:Cu(I)/Ag(I) efflux system membrane fusion protein